MAVQRLVNVGTNAGDFDPIPMQFYGPVRSDENGEQRVTYQRTVQVHVRVMAGLTREVRLQGRQETAGTQIFRIRRNAVTERIDETMIGKWRGRSYEVTGINYPNLEDLEVYTTRSDKVLP